VLLRRLLVDRAEDLRPLVDRPVVLVELVREILPDDRLPRVPVEEVARADRDEPDWRPRAEPDFLPRVSPEPFARVLPLALRLEVLRVPPVLVWRVLEALLLFSDFDLDAARAG
jgi:hypothetical protein